MQLLLSLVCFVLAAAASHNAGFDGESTRIDPVDLKTRSDLPEILAPENQCIANFYQNGASKDMCGASTVSSVMDPQCRLGTASLVDDCNALIQDIQDKNGGGFWGYANGSTIVVASHDTCTFSVTIHNDVGLFNIGTEDMTDLIKQALTTKEQCDGKAMVAATGDTSCKYRNNGIDTVWLVSGPNQICGGEG